MSRRFQFSLRALLVLMLAVGCFFGGIRFERERRRREDENVREMARSASEAELRRYTAEMKAAIQALKDLGSGFVVHEIQETVADRSPDER